MKQEIKDIVVQAAVSTPTSTYAILTRISIAEWIAIAMFILQALYLLRKWWREETEWGMRLKRWTKGNFTQPGDLS
ncbi:hypothetical protein [Hydrogenophaga laconesensis]|uniref:Holin n=1 Tax=Hydrogenophaga laconesensis TaxID=1805971 RepID=A0ABU1V4A0_9BURK|nr:hypothetical protein [Hydrogenophaga laconesensis]MDR7092280.1 hypothetical protein [Hydrogenophaga laconesensis]